MESQKKEYKIAVASQATNKTVDDFSFVSRLIFQIFIVLLIAVETDNGLKDHHLVP